MSNKNWQNDKQCRPRSDWSYRCSLIWVYTVCSNLFVQIASINITNIFIQVAQIFFSSNCSQQPQFFFFFFFKKLTKIATLRIRLSRITLNTDVLLGLQIRWQLWDNFSYITIKTNIHVCCGYSLEATLRGASNECPQHMFLWRNKKNYPRIIIKNSSLSSPMKHIYFLFGPYLGHRMMMIIWSFTSLSTLFVISRWWNGNNERICAMKRQTVIRWILPSAEPLYPKSGAITTQPPALFHLT